MATAPDSQTRTSRRSSLRTTLVTLLSFMVVATALTITALSYRTARRNTLASSATILGRVAGLTHERVRGFLEPPRTATELAARSLEQGVVDVDDVEALELYLFNALAVYRSLSSLSYGDVRGNFVMVRRDSSGSLDTKLVVHDDEGRRRVRWKHREPGRQATDVSRTETDPQDTFDPRKRPWFTGAQTTGALHWTDVYVFWTDRAPGVTISAPVSRGGKLAGVVAADVTLLEFSRFLSTVPISDNGQAFLIDEQARVIATPDASNLVLQREVDGEPQLSLRTVAESGNEPLTALGAQELFQGLLGGGQSELQNLRYTVAGKDLLATILPIELGSTRWLVAVIAPEDDFLGEVREQNRSNLITAVILGLFALVASLLLATWISRQLKLLVAQSDKIRNLELDRETVAGRTPFGEIQDVLDAFESTKTGLRSFQKYMPVLLVRQLLEAREEPQLGGTLEEVTVLFSDLEGYTSLSEKLGTTRMAKRLGPYMAGLSSAIQNRQGTVLQYVGDAIMAFWNAPLPVEDHPVQACRAALEAAAVAEAHYADDERTIPMRTRFGIHTDRVSVGHFGSPDRMYYGAIGDGVNLASRIEGANKQYGTWIMISEATCTRVRDVFEARLIDSIVVKGSELAMDVYELLGARGDVEDDVLEARDHYEAGLAHYRDRRWEAAIARFEQARKLRSDDRASEVLIERCRRHGDQPPPADWDGSFVMPTK